MILISLILILLFIILGLSKNYYTYEENFVTKCNQLKYTPTCDKKIMYNKLADMAASLSKVNYKLNKLEFDASKTELNRMYIWYKKQLEIEDRQKKIGAQNANKVRNQLAQQAMQDNDEIDNNYMKQDAKRHNKQVSKYKSQLFS